MNHPTHRAVQYKNTTKISNPESELQHNSSENGIIHKIPAEAELHPEHRLILTLEGKIIREFSLCGSELSIGRKNGNDIQLNDLTLSGKHARMTRIAGDVFIEDFESTNGTLVNGCHVNKACLIHGDVIQIGHHQLTYLCKNNTQYEPTMFIRAEFDETQFISTQDHSDKNIIKGMSLGALYSTGNNPGPPLPVMELRKSYNTIGFKGKSMALITRGSDKYTITTLIGRHSRRAFDIPLLNGKLLDENQHILKPGDIINIAGYEVSFYYL